ncbi:N-acetylglucosamine-6-phosphate deacetylase [Bacillus taeanensis]|uniref:N-acetylglucosamine-6-phosphate deacetylase n=1 Tax=Bacillus taeanensis TaxID=273032 RepID=A0A366XUY3_9BACI|nr:N-acetylglucosamine-6-phosphate deacetylase [Bacillus taeanensis]RBW70200.1 N-acetylglucosamine-6-phosphate deacetylase [Bacillus taeanensis]
MCKGVEILKSFIIKNMTLYAEENTYKNGYIKVVNGKIAEIGANDQQLSDIEGYQVIELPKNTAVIPGMIDVHIHGAAGADTMDGSIEALHTIANALPKEGTTSFLATTMTQSEEAIEKALKNVGKFISEEQTAGKAEVIGVHLEGPFISKKRVGAQPVDYVIEPSLALFKKWQDLSEGNIKLVTIAPEEKGGLELIRYLKKTGVTASIGHSDAIYEEVDEAIKAGASHVTHLFNGMRGLHHREPGVAGAALLRDELMVELIADGIHVRPEMIQLTYKQKTSDRMILITDAMRAKCLKNGVYDLGGQEVHVDEQQATLSNGTLAGSILKMNDACKNVLHYTSCSLESIIKMTAVNPAKQLHVFDRKGSIKEGKDADLVVLDKDFNVVMTFCRGELAYKREEL